jgi:putative transposase
MEVSQATAAKYMPRRTTPPSQTWRTFLANHVQQIAAADFFVVPTATCRLLFVLVLLAHERRGVVHVAVTDHPTAAWTAQQLREAFRGTKPGVICSAIATPRLRRGRRPRGRSASMK